MEGGSNSLWNLTKDIFKSRLQVKEKYSGRCPYISFTLVTKVCFLLRIKQKWRFRMETLSSLSLVCTEYLMHRKNIKGVKLEY